MDFVASKLTYINLVFSNLFSFFLMMIMMMVMVMLMLIVVVSSLYLL